MTIYDIAREANVSISTVSRVINNHPGIKPKTREKVQQVLDRSNYVPSVIARGLVNSTTLKMVGIITPDIRSEHHANTAYTIEQELTRWGYGCILCSTGKDPKRQEHYFNMMAERKVDGIILVGSVFQSHTVEKLIQQYMPNISIVITNGYIELDNVYSIITDECSAVEKCVTLLYEKKRDKIAFVMDDTTNSILEKKKGYLKAIESLSLSDRKLIVKTDHNIEECKRACHKILELMPDTNAIICGEDITAVTIMNELSRIGKKIPDDIAVIGCNNSKYAELSLPMLTSVNNNQEAVGATAARILRDALEGRKVPKKTIISADIVFRKSTP